MIKIILIILFNIISLSASGKTYSVGVESYIDHPYQSVKANGEFYGVLKDILDSFAKEEGINFIYKPYKSAELYKEFLSGNLDFKFPDNYIWKFAEKEGHNIIYSIIVTHYIDGIFIKKSDLGKKMKEFKIFGTNKGDDIVHILSKKQKDGRIDVTNAQTCSELISKIMAGEIDAIFCNYDVMRYLLKGSLYEKEVVFNPDFLFIDNYFYLSTIKHKEIIEKFNKWVIKNRQYIERVAHEQI